MKLNRDFVCSEDKWSRILEYDATLALSLSLFFVSILCSDNELNMQADGNRNTIRNIVLMLIITIPVKQILAKSFGWDLYGIAFISACTHTHTPHLQYNSNELSQFILFILLCVVYHSTNLPNLPTATFTLAILLLLLLYIYPICRMIQFHFFFALLLRALASFFLEENHNAVFALSFSGDRCFVLHLSKSS